MREKLPEENVKVFSTLQTMTYVEDRNKAIVELRIKKILVRERYGRRSKK